jgi:excisionase family DNA binding protein
MTTTPAEWLTIDEAAARLGCSTRTLQRRVADGKVAAQRREDGRTLVEVKLPQATNTDAVVGQLQRQADDTNRIAALAAVASEQAALAFRDRLATVEVALSDARADGRRWRIAFSIAASVTLSAVVMAAFLSGQAAATERQLSDTAARLQAAEAACTRLSDDLAGMTEARHLSDAEAARLREQVDALQTLGAAPAADCPTVVADAILRLQ